MNCYLHPDTTATAFCRSCGRPLCSLCQHSADGTIYCQDHFPVPYAEPGPYAAQPGAYAPQSGAAYAAQPGTNPSAANPYVQPPPVPGTHPGVQTSPGLAFLLGWIPGVGAIYNGQYLKGLVHAIIFGLLISLVNSADGTAGQPFLIMTMIGFIFYMPFEAYHTAKKRQMGIPVEEWSSLMGPGRHSSRAPIGPILLILIGLLFLLDTLHLIEFREIGRFWPVLLIVVGAYLLYARVSGTRPPAPHPFTNSDATRPTMETPHER